MTANIKAVAGELDVPPELVPVIGPGAAALALPQPAGADKAVLDDLLSDALFGEVIDISELIPRVLSSSADASTLGTSAADTAGPTQPDLADGGGILVAGEATMLTILYDDGILASDGTIF